jgi:hypothetical protein
VEKYRTGRAEDEGFAANYRVYSIKVFKASSGCRCCAKAVRRSSRSAVVE